MIPAAQLTMARRKYMPEPQPHKCWMSRCRHAYDRISGTDASIVPYQGMSWQRLLKLLGSAEIQGGTLLQL